MKKTFFILIAFYSFIGFSQFQINGDASQSSDSCFIITPDLEAQSGNIWTTEKIDLRSSFDYRFRMYFGATDEFGADGFVFALQPISNTVGGTGGGLGFAGITPSFGVEFDTYQNSGDYNDPAADHMAILQNGSVSHWTGGGTLAGPVDISPISPNVEDDQFHWVRFTWSPDSNTFHVYYDCEKRLTYTGNIITQIFNNDPLVYWGVTGGTGLYHNRQEVCLVDLGEESPPLESQSLCNNDSLQLSVLNSSAFKYTWSPNYNITATNISNPLVFPDSTTSYAVLIRDECLNPTRDTVTIFVPHALDSIADSIICIDAEIIIQPLVLKDAIYSWNDSLFEDELIITDEGVYFFQSEEYTCLYRDTFNISLDDCREIPVPNIFTPNNDGFNEMFDLSSITLDEEWNLIVYNRWGRLVYSMLAYDNSWNGDELADGSYFYHIEKAGDSIAHKGWVQISR